MDEKMIQLESELGRYLDAYQRTDIPGERDKIFNNFIEALDTAISDSNYQGTDTVIFNAVGYWLAWELRIDELWRWIRKVARDVTGNRRITLEISLLAGIPEDEPPESNHLVQLFDCLVDPELQWMIPAAYENYPDRLHGHFCHYLRLTGRF
ncbi:MAG: hypothetical protein H0X66_14920 [Verrucomicrobia bacterium]|nr:hypothetical protein [Verrucomicrobiota bacterium]